MNKILLTGDIHIGVRGDSDVYLDIFSKWITNFLIPTIQKEEISHVFILGDFFNNRNVSNIKSLNVAISMLDHMIRVLPKVKIYIIAGNHDIYYRSSREVSSLKTFENRYKNLHIVNNIELLEICDRKIVCSPWLVNNEEIDKLFSYRADLCLGHFEISGFDLVRGVKENNGLSQKKLKECFTKIFSGHFHLHQEQGNISYVANPYQMDWNDWNDQKGVTIIDLKTMKHKFIENKISPTYQKIFYSKLKNKTADLSTVSGNFIQLVIDEICSDNNLEKLQILIEKKSPISLTIDGLSIGAELSVEEIEEELSSPIEYLTNYIKKVKFPKEDFQYNRQKISKMIQEIYGRCIK